MQGNTDAVSPMVPAGVSNSSNPVCVEFDQSVDDLIAFNQYHIKNSKTLRPSNFRRILTWFCFLFVTTFVAITAQGQGHSSDLSSLAPWVLMFCIIWWLVFRSIRATSKKKMRQMLEEGENRNLAGRKRVTLTPVALVEKTPFSESSTKWVAIEKIVASSTHLFIYVGSTAAYIIPRSAFKSVEEFDEFRSAAIAFHTTIVPGRCKNCGYDLLGNTLGRCPECGQEIPKP